MQKGQAINGTIISVAVISSAMTWIGNYVLNAPKDSATAISSVDSRVTAVDNRLTVLCNDYQESVSRIDQNLQIIGTALHVSVVSGSATVQPCQTK